MEGENIEKAMVVRIKVIGAEAECMDMVMKLFRQRILSPTKAIMVITKEEGLTGMELCSIPMEAFIVEVGKMVCKTDTVQNTSQMERCCMENGLMGKSRGRFLFKAEES